MISTEVNLISAVSLDFMCLLAGFQEKGRSYLTSSLHPAAFSVEARRSACDVPQQERRRLVHMLMRNRESTSRLDCTLDSEVCSCPRGLPGGGGLPPSSSSDSNT